MKIRSVGAIAVCGAGESFHDGEGTAEVKRPEKLCHFPEESVWQCRQNHGVGMVAGQRPSLGMS